MAKFRELSGWRKKHGWSQGELAQKVGRSQRLVSDWEAGHTPIADEALASLRALGYDGPAEVQGADPVTRADLEEFMKAHTELLIAELRATREELVELRKAIFKGGRSST